jgi:hypothetical protein
LEKGDTLRMIVQRESTAAGGLAAGKGSYSREIVAGQSTPGKGKVALLTWSGDASVADSVLPGVS